MWRGKREGARGENRKSVNINSELCEKVGHSQRFWVHVQFKLAFNNHISKMQFFWVCINKYSSKKIGFQKVLSISYNTRRDSGGLKD